MSSTKTNIGDLTIETVSPTGGPTTMQLISDRVIITGNLSVRGTSTSIETTNSLVTDNIITLNSGFLGTNLTDFVGLTSGIEVNRGTRPTVGLRWNENLSRWELTTDGTNWNGIALAPALRRVEDDPQPNLGGNLDTNGFSIFFKALSVAPSSQPGRTVLYAINNVGTGGTALKFISKSGSSYITDELISRKKSIVYSLIF
jgi:hypothetical protein